MKAIELYLPVVLFVFPVGIFRFFLTRRRYQFVMLYKAVLTFETVDEILKFDCSKESY